MSTSRHIRVRRITLSAGVKTAVTPTGDCHNIAVGNATAGDLEIHTTDDDDTEYLVLSAGYERNIPTGPRLLRHDETVVWLKSAGGGTAVLLCY